MSARIELPSGIWAGHYEQFGREFPQQMTIEFADGIVRGDGVDGIGTFLLAGEYRVDGGDVRIGWIKTYDGAHSVLYLGSLARSALVGTWSLRGFSGGFALQPRRATTGVLS